MARDSRIISYYGGKHTMAPELIKMMPKHDAFFEGFAGSLAVFFRKPKVKFNCVNDFDKDLANLYYVCSKKELFDEFQNSAFFLIQSRDIYDIIRTRINQKKKYITIPDVERAAEYFFFIRNSFNNRPGTSLSKNVSKWDTDILTEIEWGRKKLDNVLVENMDIVKLIEKHWRVKNALWFLDPPYWVANGTTYYGHVFNEYDHTRFLNGVNQLRENPTNNIMITYDDHPKIRELFSDYYIKEIGVKYTSTDETIDTNEIIISNFKIEDDQLELFSKV
jgi:DNA adenine methylase